MTSVVLDDGRLFGLLIFCWNGDNGLVSSELTKFETFLRPAQCPEYIERIVIIRKAINGM